MIEALFLLVASTSVEVLPKPINCKSIYGGKRLENKSDIVVDGVLDFSTNEPFIRVRNVRKGPRLKVIPVSKREPGEGEIWFCPDYWKPSKTIETGRFYLEHDGTDPDGTKIFRIRYAETR